MSIKYTFFGHAAHGLEINGKRIIIDPFFTYNPVASISADAVDADFILVSHGHSDHLGDTIEIAKRTGATAIANAEIAEWLRTQGVPAEQIHSQHIGGGYQHEFGHVKLTIAHHGSGLPDGSNGGNPVGFLITAEGKKLYFACDTALFLDMQLYGDEGIDLFVTPIGDSYTMGPDDALRAVKLVKPKMVMPCHCRAWPVIEQDAAAWAKRVESETDVRVHVLEPGESLAL